MPRRKATELTFGIIREEGGIKITPNVSMVKDKRDWVFPKEARPSDIKNCVGAIARVLIALLRIEGIQRVSINKKRILVAIDEPHRDPFIWAKITQEVEDAAILFFKPKKLDYE